MRAMFFALSADDVGELLPSVFEVIVNYSVFELAGSCDSSARAFCMRRWMTSSASWPRARMRRSSSSIEGGRMKMPTVPG